jgi:hypothetical protein
MIDGIILQKEPTRFKLQTKKKSEFILDSPYYLELIFTLYELYFKLTNSKLKLSAINEKDKDLIRNYIKDKEKEKQKNNIFEKNIADITSTIDKYDINMEYSDNNPFRKSLIGGSAMLTGGAITSAAGLGPLGYSAYLFSQASLYSKASTLISLAWSGSSAVTTGNIALSCIGVAGIGITSVGIVVALPSLLLYGGYKTYKFVKDKYFYKFYEDFDKKEIEKKVFFYTFNKIQKYYKKFFFVNVQEKKSKIDLCHAYLKKISEILFNADKANLEKIIKDNNLKDCSYKKIYLEPIIVLKNMEKLMQGLYEEIIGSDQDTEQIFNNGIPFFRELIYCFGPENIDDEKVDKYIDKIIKIMKDIFHAKLPIAIKAFKPQTFNNSFDGYLINMNEEKKKKGEESKTFIEDCKSHIIEPIADKYKNHGVMSLYSEFFEIILNKAYELKKDDYNKRKQIIENAFKIK